MKSNTNSARADASHTLLSAEEKHAIRVAIERYKQTGKIVSLREFISKKLRK